MDNNKEMIEGLVSQILDDYHDDKIINQQALFSQPDKEAVCDLLSKLIKIMYPGYFKGTSFRYYNLDSQIAVLLEDIMYNLRKQWCLPCRRILNTGAYHITSLSICLRKSAMISLKDSKNQSFGGD